MTTKAEQIAAARAAADRLRDAWPAKAAEIDAAIADLEAGRRESLKIAGTIRATVEKFDGDYEPGKKPVETIVTTEAL